MVRFSGFPSVNAVIEGGHRKIIRVIYDPTVFGRKNVKRYQTSALEAVKNLCKTKCIPIEEIADSTEIVGGIAVECEARIFGAFSAAPENHSSFLCYLDGVEDPYNIGQAVRVLYAMGFDGIVLPGEGFVISEEILCRSSAGASELMPIFVMPAEDAARAFTKAKYDIVCAEMSTHSVPLSSAKFGNRILLVVGGEKRGISQPLLRAATTLVKIEYGRDCAIALPAASAAAIIGYEISKSRKFS